MIFSKRLDAENAYFVISGGKIVGKVRKVENWVVRGTRISWEAYQAGKYVGSYETRKAAGESLCLDATVI